MIAKIKYSNNESQVTSVSNTIDTDEERITWSKQVHKIILKNIKREFFEIALFINNTLIYYFSKDFSHYDDYIITGNIPNNSILND